METSNRKIIIISSKLHRGGAEMHLINLCNMLIKLGVKTEIIVTQGKGDYEKFLDTSIKVHYPKLNFNSYSLSLLNSYFHLRRGIKNSKSELIISIQDGPNVVSLFHKYLHKKKLPRMIIVQNNPESLKRSLQGRIIFFFAKKLYSEADAFISLSEGVAGSYQKAINIKKNITIIPNIGNLNPSCIKENKEGLEEKIKLLAVGRLEEQKDYPTMLHAIAKTVKKNPEKVITLTILGNGSQQSRLIELSKELGIIDLIYFKGFVSDTATFYKNADILLLSSKWEGFGNVIVEAMSYALPVIGTDCPYGPSEIIQHGKNGFLTEVGNSKSISDYLSLLINDDLLYQKMSESAHKSSLQYRGKEIASRYLNVIEKII